MEKNNETANEEMPVGEPVKEAINEENPQKEKEQKSMGEPADQAKHD